MRGSIFLALSALGLLVGCPSQGDIGGPSDCATYYPDLDGDGLGDPRLPVTLCEGQEGYVRDGSDDEPDCATNDTDDCGVCAGGNADMDCQGLCFGPAQLDTCAFCTGGTTGRIPVSSLDSDGDGLPDACDACFGGEVGRLVVEYAGVPAYGGGGGPYNIAVTLNETGEILFSYGDLGEFTATANIGLQNSAGDLGVDMVADGDYLGAHPNLVYSWDSGLGNFSLADGAEMPYSSLAAVGGAISLGDDDISYVTLPFAFPFYGETYLTMGVSSNGFFMLGDGSLPTYDNVTLPTGMPGALIAPLWDDLNPGIGGEVRFYGSSTCEVDCAGIAGGFARVDACAVCAGGSTGLIPDADLDCADVCGGEAFLDECGLCAGGTTGVEPSDPDSCVQLPDFVPSESYLHSTLAIEEVDVGQDSCLIEEGCVGGTGLRKVLRFGTQVGNIGTSDFYLGSPPAEGFHWDACHAHYHFDDYASYRLLDPVTGSEVTVGHKNGWCLMDSGIFDADLAAAAGNDCNRYDCGDQGIGLGCQDTYGVNLSCQWIDITGVPDGTYQVEVTVNPDFDIEELDMTNNQATATVEISGDVVTLLGP